MKRILLFLAVAFLSCIVMAESIHPLLTAQEIETHQIAKKRKYPGGQDEEALKVQSQLPLDLDKIKTEEDAPASGEANPND